jgi:hypothetical protein
VGRKRLVRVAGTVGVLLALAGCGPRVGYVSGTVTVDGKPAENGGITFFPEDGKTSVEGGNIKDGHYSVRVPPGPKKVAINISKVVGKKKLYPTPESQEMPMTKELLPERYNDQTELRLDVKPGANEKDWTLTTK